MLFLGLKTFAAFSNTELFRSLMLFQSTQLAESRDPVIMILVTVGNFLIIGFIFPKKCKNVVKGK